MYSNIKNVQILISLLKSYNIKDCVLSPGGSDIPLIHSIETDDFFSCYSVVDERSAAYYAMGMSQTKERPVACICTSGSAVCNYLPGITEAFYQNVPVVAITADKNPYFQDQLETQKIKQENIFDGVVKKSVSLPLIHVEDDKWLCNRLVNEALLELNHFGTGPVHINIPIVDRTDVFDQMILPEERKIERITEVNNDKIWEKCRFSLENYNRILVVAGQNINFSRKDVVLLNEFFKNFNCIFAVEHLSNLNCEGCIYTYPLTEMDGGNIMETLIPDLVISLGNNLSSYMLKPFLRHNYLNIENWLVRENGEIRDSYKCLTKVFQCSVSEFFNKIIENHNKKRDHKNEYYYEWKKALTTVELPEFTFSNFFVAQKLAEIIPASSLLHLAILNSTRIMQFFKLAKGVKTYSNIGTLGIDGCFSTFAGQAASTENLAFLVIGDLSFFYDMNAAGIRNVGPNVRIILLNNGGGSEFHFFMGKEKINSINDYICAEHKKTAEGWIKSLPYKYFSVKNKKELEKILPVFSEKSDRPLFMEIFTDMEADANQTKKMYNTYSEKFRQKDTVIKKVIKSVIPEGKIQKGKKILKIIKE